MHATDDVVVISDLHLASGMDGSGNFNGTENFFEDAAFVRFLDHLHAAHQGRELHLVINGDMIDYLRVIDVPAGAGLQEWREVLLPLGIDRSTASLAGSITRKEHRFGLRTNDFKSVWKLHRCVNGHRQLFERLARWIADGHHLTIVKGNHDLEWHWPAVRGYFMHFLAGAIAQRSGEEVSDVLAKQVVPRMRFAADKVIIGGQVHIEHGHRYQNMTEVKGPPVLDNGEELNLPFGSFFNRYLINRVELAYPFVDNVRPSQNILPVLLRERFPLGMKLLFSYVPLTFRMVPKRIYWETFKYLITLVLLVGVPLLLAFLVLRSEWPRMMDPATEPQGRLLAWFTGILKSGASLFLSYVFGRVLAMVRLADPNTFAPQAEEILKNDPALRVVLMGHTHDPEQVEHEGRWYVNTGTWIPVFETSSANVRTDKTYTYAHVRRTDRGWTAGPLQRWNDDALRTEPLRLTNKK